jgi:hypothetical protein
MSAMKIETTTAAGEVLTTRHRALASPLVRRLSSDRRPSLVGRVSEPWLRKRQESRQTPFPSSVKTR